MPEALQNEPSKKNAQRSGDFIRVSRPSWWMILIAATAVVAGLMVWVNAGKLPITVDCAAVAADSGELICFVSEEDAGYVKEGSAVNIVGIGSGKVTSVAAVPLSANEVTEQVGSDYIASSLGLESWSFPVTVRTSEDYALKGGVMYDLSITAFEAHPIDFLLK